MTEFISTVALNNAGPFPTFKEAVGDFMRRMKEMVGEGTSKQVLESACFITMKNGDRSSLPVDFYAVRDFAHEVGLTDKASEPIADAPEPSGTNLRQIFIISSN
ncbi:MAG: hypothetical protein V4436_00620 [Patescibacteria group bacterium]